ncbi:T-cell receptor gamma chain C region C10.5 isoform X2 [Camelus dromedarius]|uniref:T-cell receptor gamma chain C region C10.5 isoform X2 n=1 Tax=Camelus dromedarius TaxID=9838 RepID=UPI003119A3F4
MALLELAISSFFWASGLMLPQLEQPEVSVTGVRDKSVVLSCKVPSDSFDKDYIHWYQQKPDQGLKQLMYVLTASALGDLGGKKNKLEARKYASISTSTLKISFLKKEDEATYYCALWIYTSGWIKIFGEGTKLIVIPPDRKLDADMAPKPTIFFPSIAEINLDKAGTHLCLLENFFPDAIKVHWKAKDSNTVLESQQGNTIMTNDTYMKFSWLTVPEKSMDTEHICVVKHENNKGGIDQEIHFPPINQEDTTKPCLKKESDTVRLQRESTSAYYAYLLLLLKSGLYFCVVAFLLLRRTAVCGHGKGS